MIDGMIFGRSDGTKTFPDDNKMSSEHCRFHIINDEVYVEDMNSKNRTVLDRMEIIPGKKIVIRLDSMLEVGSQRFILTDRNLRLQDINGIVNEQTSHQITKLESLKLAMDLNDRNISDVEKMMGTQEELNAQIIEKRVRIGDSQKRIIQLAKETEARLNELEAQKMEILSATSDEEKKLQDEMNKLANDVNVLRTQLAKLTSGIEIKRKKIKT